MKKTIKIAFYGKGGIGKSTVAANVSAFLAASGKKVLHIGCDPKSDSTRCLTKRRIPSVLQQLERFGEELGWEDLIFPGAFGVSCMEAGGPRAGIGCAGMGITTMKETMERLRILEEDWDVIVYDVLGDVVCGGFSVPMRKNMVDQVYVVTSSDFMALYAANNILHAVAYYSGEETSLFRGFVWNHWKTAWDGRVAESFAEVTGGRILSRISESPEIKRSDGLRELFVERYPDSAPAGAIRELAEKILGEEPVLCPRALEEEELEKWMQNLYKEESRIRDGGRDYGKGL